MEWLILILLVPAIVVPIVLLWGFVGCNLVFGLDPVERSAPDLTMATPLSRDVLTPTAIKLEWGDTQVALLQVYRAETIDSVAGPFELIGAATGSNLAFVDPTDRTTPAPLGHHITYSYTLATSPTSSAVHSNILIVAPLEFLEQPGFEGNCLIQRIPSARLKNSGGIVRITVRGSKTGSLTLDRIYLSQPAAVGNTYDALPAGAPGGLTKVIDIDIDGPAAAVTLSPPDAADPNRNVKTLPVIYELDRTKDLLIAFDINPTAGQGNLAFVPLAGAEYYYRPFTQEAAQPDRLPNPALPNDKFNVDQGRHYLIEKIEVL